MKNKMLSFCIVKQCGIPQYKACTKIFKFMEKLKIIMKSIIALGLVAIFLASVAIPGAYGSYLNVTIYPQKNLASVNLSSDTYLIITYPANQNIQNKTWTYTASATFTHPSDWAISFIEGFLKSRYQNVSVENMSVNFTLIGTMNWTTFQIYKHVTINLWLTGIFNKTKSETNVNLSWRDFEVKGSFKIKDHNGDEFELNDMGDYLNGFFLVSLMGDTMEKLNDKSTLNFTALSKPLSEWNRTYNPSTNTTTFSYTANENVLLNASLTINGNTYTLLLKYDPSSTITTQGYATASGDSIVILPNAPSSINSGTVIAIVAVVVIIVGIVAAIAVRKAKK